MTPALSFPFSGRRRLPALGLALGCALAGPPGAIAAQAGQAPPDFSGAWRLDDQHSDSPDAVAELLRREAKREASPQVGGATPAANGKAPAAGGGRGGGMGGRHGSGMGGGGGGGMGGGHGGRGRRGGNDDASGTASAASGPVDYPLPPLLKIDSVLLVQQDAQTLQIRLDSGELLGGRWSGPAQQSLNGNAMVSTRADAGGLQVGIQFADGSRLDEHWVRSADGRQLTVFGQWRPPMLQQPVSFKRSYVALGG